MNLTAAPPLDPHLIIETCPKCGSQKIVGYIYPLFGSAIGWCELCRKERELERKQAQLERF